MLKKLIVIVSVIIFSVVLLAYLTVPRILDRNIKEYVEIDYNETFDYTAGTLIYGSILNHKEVQPDVYGNVDTSKVGEYSITYKYPNGFGFEQTVNVVDRKKPVIDMDDDIIELCPNGKIKKDVKAKAYDEYDGDLTDKIELKMDNENYYLEVKDNSNNVSIKDLNPKIIDDKPTLTLIGNKKITINVGDKYTDKSAKLEDDCDDDIELVTTGSVNTAKEGTYTLTYSAKDSSDNEVKVTRTVVVEKLVKRSASEPKALVGKKIVYLTFDDGPSKHTARLLDVLKKYNVKATFFVTGYGSDAMIKREYEEGHTIALHTYTHQWSIYKNEDTYFADLNKIKNRVKRITGHEPKFIRFAGGSSNTVSRKYDGGTHVMSRLVVAVEKQGYKYFDWNVTSGDAWATKDTNQVYKNVIKGLKKNYSIVLQHDSKGYSVDAVEKIIKYGLENGFTFKPIDDDTPVVHHHVNN